MALKDYVLDLIKEYREQGINTIPLKTVVEEVVKAKGVYPNSVYLAVRMLAMEGKIKITGNNKNKIIVLQSATPP